LQYLHVDSDRAFDQLLRRLATAESIAFDTEFVSEDCYQPDLCLIQVATEDDLAVIDPKAVSDLTPFWELLTDSTPETIVHAGREELRFIWRETGRRPKHLFDVQIAAGLIGRMLPQFQIFFLAMPATILIGMLVMLAVLAVMMSVFIENLGGFIRQIGGL